MTTIKHRRGNVEDWALVNPILAEGEIGVELDTRRFKIGDGTSTWSQLPYFSNALDLSEIYVNKAGDTMSGGIRFLSADDPLVLSDGGNEYISLRPQYPVPDRDFPVFEVALESGADNPVSAFTVGINVISAKGSQIKDVGEPTDDRDAVTKMYFDANIPDPIPGPPGPVGPQGPPGGAVLSGVWTYSDVASGPAPSGQIRTSGGAGVGTPMTVWLNPVDSNGLDWSIVTSQVGDVLFIRNASGESWMLEVTSVPGNTQIETTIVSSTAQPPRKNTAVEVSLVRDVPAGGGDSAHFVQYTEPDTWAEGDLWTEVSATASYSSEVLADSPLIYITLDDTGGADSSGNFRAGPTINSAGTITKDSSPLVTGSSASWRLAPNAWLEYAYSAAWMNPASLTLEAWIKPEAASLTSVHPILDRDVSGSRSWQFRLNGGKLETTIWTASHVALLGATVLQAGQIYHVAATYNSTTNLMKLYVNGALEAQSTHTWGGAVAVTSCPFYIGSGGGGIGMGSGGYFTGLIDEVALYGTALSDARLLAHYTAGTADPATAPVLHQNINGAAVPLTYAPLIVLGLNDPVPPGTLDGTVIIRTEA